MNHFLEIVLNCVDETKYSRWYASIITNALIRGYSRKTAKATFGYTEAHHILPQSFKLGGKRDSDNIVYLSPKEHFVCHLILSRMDFGFERNKKLKYALFCMMNQRKNGRMYKISSSLYERAKLEFSENQSKSHWTQTEEGRKRISDIMKGRPVSAYRRSVASSTHKGIPKTEEHKNKISAATTGKQKTKSDRWNEASKEKRFNWATTIVCLKCGSEVSAITHRKYHGERCGLPVEKLYWWHNPDSREAIRISSTETPPDGFVRGRGSRLLSRSQ